MAKCSFCGHQLEKGTGKMFVWISGKIDYFCSRRCEKNVLKYHRNPLRTKWTQAFRKEHRKGQKKPAKSGGEGQAGQEATSDVAGPS